MKTTYIYSIVIFGLVGGLLLFTQVRQGAHTQDQSASPAYDAFAQCLADAGAVFYGAFWCPHCQNQKEALQHSKFIPYVECSTPDRQGQTQVCIDENITGYPTWKFADGSVLSGELPVETLAEKTNCPLPTS